MKRFPLLKQAFKLDSPYNVSISFGDSLQPLTYPHPLSNGTIYFNLIDSKWNSHGLKYQLVQNEIGLQYMYIHDWN